MRSFLRILVSLAAFGMLPACLGGGGSGDDTTNTVERTLEAAQILSNEELQNFIVTGTLTTDFSSTLPAIYNGHAVVDFYDDSATIRDRLRADLLLTATFSDSTITGFFLNPTLQKAGQDSPEPLDGYAFIIPITGFDDTGFKGDFSITRGSEGTFDLSYKGSLYGPNAESVAGVISGTAELDGSRIARGWFGGDQSE